MWCITIREQEAIRDKLLEFPPFTFMVVLKVSHTVLPTIGGRVV